MKIYFNFNKYNNNIELLLKEIIKYFKDYKNLIIIFDNILSKEEYSFVNNIKDKINIFEYEIYIREFIEINENTLNILKNFFDKNIRLEMIGSWKNNKLLDDLNIVVEYMNNKEMYLSSYKNSINNKIQEKFKNFTINKFINLIKLYHFLYTKEISQKESKQIILYDEIKEFIEFLYININNGKITKISFRNNIIENYFNNFYIFYSNIFFYKEESKVVIKELLESEKGIKFERHIIFSIIIGNFTNNYIKVNINRIYCIEQFEKFKANDNILFYQMNSNAPMYDFAILIKNENYYILKVYQVSISKDEEDLEKLDKDKIKYDLSYFIEKVNRILNIEIKNFSFGIITSYQNYLNKKANTQLISNFCIKNKYELLLYDINDNKLYLNESYAQNEYHLKEKNSFEDINIHLFNFKNIFKNGYKIPKKYFIEKVKTSIIIENIKKSFSSISEEINPKLFINIKL